MKRKSFVIVGVILAFLGISAFLKYPLFSKAWPHLLMIKAPMAQADCLILLGGDQESRPGKTAKLYKEGVAKKIFITGEGDAAANKKHLLDEGVPSSAIIIEPAARSTLMNARLLHPILEAAGVNSAVIVTSPFHMRRALSVFQHENPKIHFGITEVSPDYWKTPKGRKTLDLNAAQECVKIGYYWIFYGIAPFPTTKR